MKTTLLLLLMLVLSYVTTAQENNFDNCGTNKPDPKRFKQRFYYSDNQALINKAYEMGFITDADETYIESMGFDIPEKAPDSTESTGGEISASLIDGDYSGIRNATIKYVPVQAYIWRNTAGTMPYSEAQVNERMNRLNEICRNSQVPIRFYQINRPLVGTTNKYYDIRTESDFVEMCGFPGPSAIKIHFVNSIIIDGESSGGKAQFPNESNPYAFAVARPAISTLETLTHEMGHVLDLVHTHESARSNAENNAACGPCHQESVSRTRRQGFCILTGTDPKKCEVNGDGFCDTEADLELSNEIVDDPACTTYTGTGTDHWGDRWRPDVRNIMSYAQACRERFSFMQAFWMYNNLPSYATTSAGYAISGPFSACPNQSLNFSVPALTGVTNYRWEVPVGWSVTVGQGTRSVTIRVGSNPVGRIRVVPNIAFPEVERGITDNRTSASISGSTSVCPNNSYTYSTVSGGSNYSWTVPSGMGISSGQGTRSITVYVYAPSGGTVSVSTTLNGCTSTGSLTVYGSYCSSSSLASAPLDSIATEQDSTVVSAARVAEDSDAVAVLFPNPAEAEVTLQFAQAGDYVVELLDDKGNKLFSQQAKKTDRVNFEISKYPKGTYYFHITTQDDKIVKRLYIK